MNRPGTSTDIEVPEVALVIVAHPDDAEFQCGATLAKWSAAGAVVHHLVLTDGSKGTWDPDADPEEVASLRRCEQRAAAEALGASGEVVFLGRRDGELASDLDTRGLVAAVIRRLRPVVVLGHDPWKRYRLHPDHRAAGHLATDGIVAARDPFFYPEQLRGGTTTHRPLALLLFEADEVNHREIVDEIAVQSKLAALEAHVSQLRSTHLYGLEQSGSGEESLDAFRLRERRKLDPEGIGTLAESYHLIVDQL